MNTRETIIFLERLELYISSGMSVVQALRSSSDNTKLRYKKVFLACISSVESGTMLSKMMPNLGISKTITGLIQHGELSGSLVNSLSTARSLLERQDDLKRKCISAMTYPIVIGVFALVLTAALVRGIMPQIIPMLQSLHVHLPLLTVIVMNISEWLMAYGIYACVALVVVLCATYMVYKRSSVFRTYLHAALIRTPILGNLLYCYSLTTFFSSCGALVRSGLPIVDAYSQSSNTVSFTPLKRTLQAQERRLCQGVSLGILLISKRTPSYVPSLLSAGEASGTLGQSMLRIAAILDRDIDHSLKRVTSLIEPIMMAGMGCIVGSIAVSIMMPIYDVSKVLQHA